MVKKTFLKRTSYVVVAVILAVTAVPIVPVSNVWADTECIASHKENGEAAYNLLNNKLSATADNVEVTLCAGSDFSEYPWGITAANIKNLTLHLNGNTLRLAATNVKNGQTRTIDGGAIISKNDNTVFNNEGTIKLRNITYNGNSNSYRFVRNKVDAAKLIIESGNYSNTGPLFWREATGSRFEFTGGVFDRDVNNLLPENFGYKAYLNQSDKKWHIETKLTNENITAPDTIVLKEGEVFDVASAMGLPVDSTTGFVYYSRNNDVANINYHGMNNNGTSGLLGVNAGTTSIAVRPTYDTNIIKNINVRVETGLKSISVDDISMTQEDTKNVQIRNEYYYDVANGVTYQLVNNTPLQAIVSEQGLITVSTGANGVIDAGEYTITVNALANGNVVASDDFTVTVGKVFTDFTLKEADDQGKIKIKEDEWFQLNIDTTTTMGGVDGVSITNISVLNMSSDGLMHAREDRIAGDRQGAGNATIEVTAKYVSNNGNEYIATERFSVEVVSALDDVSVQDETGAEVQNVVFDRDKTVDLVAKAKSSTAGVYYSAVSDDEAIANVTIDRETGAMHISSAKAGMTTIEVKATSKDGSVEKTVVLNVTVNKILETLNVDNVSVDQGSGGVITPTVEDDVDVEYTFEIVGGGLGVIDLNRNTGVFSTELGNGKSGVVLVKVTAREVAGIEHREKEKNITITVGPVLSNFGLDFTDYFKKNGETQYEIYEKDTTEILISDIVNSEIDESDIRSWNYEIIEGNDYVALDGKKVTGIKDGVAVIKVTGVYISDSGMEYSVDKQVTVVVKPLLTGVRIKNESGENTKPNVPQVLYENDEVVYTVQHINKRASVDYSVETSDASIAVAELDGANLIIKTFEHTTVAGEEAVITVTATDRENPNITASRFIKIAVKPTLKTLNVDDVYLKVGDKEALNITWENSAITPEIEYHIADNRLAIKSSGNGVRGIKAGETQATVKASFDGKTIEKTIGVHIYEMETPLHHHFYGATGQVFNVHVGDKNRNAYTMANVDKPWGIIMAGDRVIAFIPGVYTVTYTDYMANGEKVDEYTAKFTVFRVERETVAVARGETKELDGHSEWSTSSAKDAVTGHHLRVNSKGKTVFTTDENTELGVHDVTMKHMFRYDAREVVKEVTVIVYDVNADPESDPAGVTGDTLKEYIEGMFDDVSSLDDLMARLEATREIFGDGFEGLLSVMGLSGAVMGGNEIDTRVEVTKLDEEDVNEAMISAVEALDVDGAEYYDVSVWMASNGVDLGKLHQLNNKIVVALAKVTDPESGYTRQYIVIRQHDGEDPEVLVEGVDFYIEDGVLYVISDKFSTYAVAYQDTMIPAYGGVTYTTTIKAPETGKASEQSGATAQAIDMNIVVAVLGAAAVLLMAGAVVCAKRK